MLAADKLLTTARQLRLQELHCSAPGASRGNGQINRVTFGFYAPDELREIAVCTITEPRTFDPDAPAASGSDPRLGPTERGLICPTQSNRAALRRAFGCD